LQKSLIQAAAELRDGMAKPSEFAPENVSRQVEGVTSRIKIALKNSRLSTAQRKCDGKQFEARRSSVA
jgi:hypothetical protein